MKVYKKEDLGLKIGDFLDVKGQKVKILNIKQIKEDLWEYETEDLKEEEPNLEGDNYDELG